ncbi:MAG: type VI secretion system baseplate subunit TssG [Polyangia bacterium]
MATVKAPAAAESEPAQIRELLAPGAAASYHPYQALRLLEVFGVKHGAPLLGEISQDLDRARTAPSEIIRIRPSVSMAFPAASLESVERTSGSGPDGSRYQVTVSFGGLYGSDTPLPLWMAQEILWGGKQHPAARAFLDIMHHRLLSLRYRAWRQHRYEYSFARGGRDRLSRILMGIVGLSPEQPAQDLGATPLWLFRHFGLLLLRNRPASALATLLNAKLRAEMPDEPHLNVSVTLLPPPRWIRLPDEQVAYLGRRGAAGVGRHTLMGRSVRDRASYIQLVIGVVSFRNALRLRTQKGGLLDQLVSLCRFYLRQPLDLSFQVQVPADEVPRSTLGRNPPQRVQGTIPATLSSGVSAILGRLIATETVERASHDGRALITFSLPMQTA